MIKYNSYHKKHSQGKRILPSWIFGKIAMTDTATDRIRLKLTKNLCSPQFSPCKINNVIQWISDSCITFTGYAQIIYHSDRKINFYYHLQYINTYTFLNNKILKQNSDDKNVCLLCILLLHGCTHAGIVNVE